MTLDEKMKVKAGFAAHTIVDIWFERAKHASENKGKAILGAYNGFTTALAMKPPPDFTTELMWTLFFAALAFVPGAAYTAAISYGLVLKRVKALQFGFDSLSGRQVEFMISYSKFSAKAVEYKDLLSLGADQARNAVTRVQAMKNFDRANSGVRTKATATELQTVFNSFMQQLADEEEFLIDQKEMWLNLVDRYVLEDYIQMYLPPPFVPRKIAIQPIDHWINLILGSPGHVTFAKIDDLALAFEQQMWTIYLTNHVLLSPIPPFEILEGLGSEQFKYLSQTRFPTHIHSTQDLAAWGAKFRQRPAIPAREGRAPSIPADPPPPPGLPRT
jgi:hypothetical protein